jgi:hypothetical protein
MAAPAALRTAEEWDTCGNFSSLFWALKDNRSTRKWYCFALACIRLAWGELPEHCRKSIETTELYAEKRVTNRDRAQVRTLIPRRRTVAEEASYLATAAPTDIKGCARALPFQVLPLVAPVRGVHAFDQDVLRLLRDVFVNPFRDVQIDPAWLSWSDGAVRGVAETIYDEGEFARVPILADALEEAGCTHEVILGHLRNGRQHVGGCWVVDLVLKKK